MQRVQVPQREKFRDDPVGRLHAPLLQKIKPDGVNIQDRVFGELE